MYPDQSFDWVESFLDSLAVERCNQNLKLMNGGVLRLYSASILSHK